MSLPKTTKEVQSLTGRVAALNRFVSKATDKCFPFFKTLKKAFAWMEECETAFQELKHYLSNPSLLSPSKEGEDLFLYLAVSVTAVSAALIREENKVQLLVYYVSQAFQGVEARYSPIEKITFALIVASRKLRPFLQANPIIVMTDQPIKKAMNKPEIAGRMVQWAIELSQFDVEYRPRIAIKTQALVDFISEFTTPEDANCQEDLWTINTDGSSTQQGGGAGIVITSPKNDVLEYGVQLKYSITNNEAEYEALLGGLRIARALGAEKIVLKSDFQLVIGQVRGDFEAKETRMQKYLNLVNQLVSTFLYAEFIQIPRDQNTKAEKIARSASMHNLGNMNDWKLEEQNSPSIMEFQTFSIQNSSGWTNPILSFLQDG